MKHIKFISLLSIALCLPQISLAMEQNSQGHYEQLQNCSVCFESLYPCQNIKIIACGHIFHSACIEPWLARGGACPLCRADVVADTPAAIEPSISLGEEEWPFLFLGEESSSELDNRPVLDQIFFGLREWFLLVPQLIGGRETRESHLQWISVSRQNDVIDRLVAEALGVHGLGIHGFTSRAAQLLARDRGYGAIMNRLLSPFEQFPQANVLQIGCATISRSNNL